MQPQTVLKKQKGISPIWTLPILAIALCAWLLYRSIMEAGIEIEVYFDDATGITPAKTQVMAMGIPLGLVMKIEPDVERHKVRAIIKMDRSTEQYLVEDAKFWITKPEVSAKRITGLETILSGSYISVQRGKSTKPARVFMALSSAPPIPDDTPGLHIKLRSSALRSIQEGSSIYFRNIKIGSVKSYKLEEDKSILIDCFIHPQYKNLIREGSRFYDASGVTFSGKLTNLKIRMESIAALFVGGIVVSTPEALSESAIAKSGDVFTLYEDFEAADYGIAMTLNLASGMGITEGATKIMYRGLEAGYVKRISINDDTERSVTAHILLDPRAEIILREKTSFWLVSPEFSTSGIQNIGTVISGPYITFKPGDGEFQDHFEILPEPPAKAPLRPGKMFRLISSEMTKASSGSPVYYLKKKIGEVVDSEITADRSSLETSIFIYDSYTDIITPTTVFIETGGISINAGFTGFSVNFDPILAALKGGIEVLKPPENNNGNSETAAENSQFVLFADHESALAEIPALKPEGLYIQLDATDLDSYGLGSPILYKKVKVGQVIGFKLSPKQKGVRISCFINKEYSDLVSSSSQFYKASGIRVNADLSGISVETESLESLMSGGIAFMTPPGGKAVGNDPTFNLYDSIKQVQAIDDTTIVVRFKKAVQLSANAPVRHQGIRIGSVNKLSFDKDLSTVIATLSIKKPYDTFFRERTKIWVASPKVNLSGVQNLETIIFGAFIDLRPGTGELKKEFIGLEQAPQPLITVNSGLNIVLEAKHLGSLDVGSPVYYRQVKVGEVIGYDLAFNFKDVLIYANIYDRYAQIVRENTRFWNASGVTVKGGIFSGITVSTQSFNSLITGGIALATPGKEEMGPPVYTGFHFLLYDEPQTGWLDWSPEIFAIEKEKVDLEKLTIPQE